MSNSDLDLRTGFDTNSDLDLRSRFDPSPGSGFSAEIGLGSALDLRTGFDVESRPGPEDWI